jgi:hypothetical protein
MANSSSPLVPVCALCGKPCDSEACKVTYDGKPAHEQCLAAKIASQKPT